MYKEFYGLTEEPFNLTPDPKFLYLSENHREGLAHLQYGITRKSSPIILTGEMGTGKTTLLYSLIERLDERTKIVFLAHSQLNFTEILQHILHAFGIDGHNKSKGELLISLKDILVNCSKTEENVLLILDEAQNFSESILEELRLLTNIENTKEKLMQIVLVGQIGLNEKLRLPELAQLRQRIGINYCLLPLNHLESRDYIEKRLAIAGASRPIFTIEAIEAIYTYSKGTPRVINMMCDLALLFGFTDNKPEIGRTVIRDVEESLNLYQPTKHTNHTLGLERSDDRMDAIVIKEARGDLAQHESLIRPNNPEGLEQLKTQPFRWRFTRLGRIAIGASAVLLGLICVGLSWQSRVNGMPLINSWSHALQSLLTWGQPPAQDTDLPQRHHVEPILPSSDNGIRKMRDRDGMLNRPSKSMNMEESIGVKSFPKELILPSDTGATSFEKNDVTNIPTQLLPARVVTVQEGATLTTIILKQYGVFDTKILSLVLRANPDLLDRNRLEVGQRITLPVLPKAILE